MTNPAYPAKSGVSFLMTGQVPYSQEAEEAVIGAVLVNPEAFLGVASFLQPDDFYILRHTYIWEALQRLSERNENIDYLTVQEELRAANRLGEIGGPAYLTQLMNSMPTSMHAEIYGRLVERTAIRRRLMVTADEIKGLALDEELPIEKVTDEAEAKLFRITERNLRRDVVPMREAISDYFDRIEHLMQHQDEPLGLPSGFRDLDQLLGGLQRSDLLIFAGRPGMGKTSFLLSIAMNTAKLGARIAIFTMEMGYEQITQRFMSMETGINTQRLRAGQIDQKEWARFVQASGRMANLGIFIDDTPALTPLQMRTKCRRLAHEFGLDLVIVDYMQLMSAGGQYENNRVQEISYISRAIKELARELNVPVISAAQLSRAVEQRQDKRPQLSDLRESGCLAGDTLVYLPDSGESVPIRALNGQSDFHVLAVDDESYKLRPAMTQHAFCTGTKPVYRLTTRLGRTIRATANHKFLTISGWKRLDELCPGDMIATPRHIAGPEAATMTDSELALLGHLIGDGCTLPRHAIQYTTREPDIAETVKALAEAVFGDSLRPRIHREPGRNWYQVFLTASQHLTHGVYNPIRSWLEPLGCFGLRSYEKFVPTAVFTQPASSVAVFLRHLWATDGCISMKRTSRGFYPVVYYATSSERLARDVQSLLLRLGINARLKVMPQPNKGRDQYHVIVTGASDLSRFIEQVGAVGERRRAIVTQIADYLETHAENTNRDVISSEVWQLHAIPAMQAHGITTRAMHAQLGNAYCGTTLYKQNISRQRAARLAEAVSSEPIRALAASDVYWDAIVEIVPDGVTDVYDLTVPGPSNFVANNIIVHNSIEQDADLVMFLYRDVVYNEATEFPNRADIIVAKHRNGPTGVVSLHFEKSLTKFSDARTQSIDLSGL